MYYFYTLLLIRLITVKKISARTNGDAGLRHGVDLQKPAAQSLGMRQHLIHLEFVVQS